MTEKRPNPLRQAYTLFCEGFVEDRRQGILSVEKARVSQWIIDSAEVMLPKLVVLTGLTLLPDQRERTARITLEDDERRTIVETEFVIPADPESDPATQRVVLLAPLQLEPFPVKAGTELSVRISSADFSYRSQSMPFVLASDFSEPTQLLAQTEELPISLVRD